MIIVEYRVPMPFSASEYQIGQLYTIAKKSRLESGDAKNGVKVNVNEPYSNGPGGQGQYTNKTYYLANKIPDWMKRILPERAAKLSEEAWNAYPYSKNKFSNPLLERLQLEIESHYLDGPPTMENVFQLSESERLSRSIVVIDLTRQPVAPNARSEHKSKRKLAGDQSSSRNNDVLSFNPLFREPLTDNWLEEYELAYGDAADAASAAPAAFLAPAAEHDGVQDDGGVIKKRLMTCYKLCRINFPVWPLQSKVEQFIQQYCQDTIVEAHKLAWLWQDEWTGMSLDQIREMEAETQSQLLSVWRQRASPLN